MHCISSHRLSFFFLSWVVLVCLFIPSHAVAIDVTVTHILPPGTTSQSIDINHARNVVEFELPLHGTLVPTSEGFDYLPDASFWDVGHDVVLLRVTSGRPTTSAMMRVELTAGTLSLEDNPVYSSTPIPGVISQPWSAYSPLENELVIVDGVVADTAFQMTVDNDATDHPHLTVIHDNTAGHQQASEHRVDVSVDDLDIRTWPQEINEFSFYEVTQNGQTLVELKAKFDRARGIWQIRPDAFSGTDLAPIDINPGYYRVKLVRWGTVGDAGADFYINNQFLGSIKGLPLFTLGPIVHQLTLTETQQHDGLRMRFEDPTLTVGQSFVDSATRLIYDSFDTNEFGNVRANWDHIEGADHIDLSNQTIAGIGKQVDLDLGSVPHWEHAYFRQDYQANPLNNYKARFWIDPTHLNIPEGNMVRVVYGCTVSATDYCVDFRLQLSKVNGELKLSLHTWDDVAGTQVIETPMTQEPHYVEFQYHTAAAPGVPTGWAKLWVDGTAVGSSEGLDNFSKKVQDVRFGSNYTSVLVTGVLSFDEIETWTY